MRLHTPQKISAAPGTPAHMPWSSALDPPNALDDSPARGTYGFEVPPDFAARIDAFVQFVRRALAHAKQTRGWSVDDVADASGISRNTIFNWRAGKVKQFPLGANVEAFCDALGIDPAEAFTLLWPGKDAKPAEPMPLGPDEDLVALARRLTDPGTRPEELFHIRETIRSLAARSAAANRVSTEDRRKREAG